MNDFSASKVDRRQSPRTKLAEIAYIGMGPENGGLVLDVSDGGLSFHAVAPVERSQTVRFLLSLHGHSRVEGAGEVVWTNDARTVCGLRFTSLSSGAREHLNNWTNQSQVPEPSAAPAAAADAADGAAAPPNETETPLTEEPFAERALPELEPLVSAANPAETETQPLFAIPPADQVLLSNSSARQQSGGGLFVWILFVLLGAAIVVAAFLYGVHVGQSQVIALMQRQTPPVTQAEAPPAPGPTASAPAAATPSVGVEKSVPNIASPNPGGAAVISSKTVDGGTNPAPAAAVQDQQTGQAGDAGKAQLAAAMADLNGASGQRDSVKAVKELWSAVGSGNSDAEIILAGLYADGVGVTKNCEQGRVLLIAAARSGNPKAKPKLDELNARGCR